MTRFALESAFESMRGNFFQPKCKREVIETLACSLRAQLSSAEKRPKPERPIPLALSGGTALPGGFLDQFMAALRPQDFPAPIHAVRMSDDPFELHSSRRVNGRGLPSLPQVASGRPGSRPLFGVMLR